MELLDHLNTLSAAEKEAFAVQVGTTLSHLRNVAYGARKASAALACQIEIESGGKVSVETLRPKDWQKIWDPRRNHSVYSGAIVGQNGAQSSDAGAEAQAKPDLVGSEGAPPVRELEGAGHAA